MAVPDAQMAVPDAHLLFAVRSGGGPNPRRARRIASGGANAVDPLAAQIGERGEVLFATAPAIIRCRVLQIRRSGACAMRPGNVHSDG